jgi:hypothetical protein
VGILLASVFLTVYGVFLALITGLLLGIKDGPIVVAEYWICLIAGASGSLPPRIGKSRRCDSRFTQAPPDSLRPCIRTAYSYEGARTREHAMSGSHSDQQGMGPVEVVVLVAACATGLFLLLPAINGGSRTPSRRTSCTFNLDHGPRRYPCR